MWLVFLVHPNKMIDSQVIRDRGRVMMRWEVRENDCGYSAMMFIIRIVVKISRRVLFCLLSFFKLKEISFLISRETLFFVVSVGLVVFHVFSGIVRITRGNIIHEIERVEEDGSNTENRFVIILSFWWGRVFLGWWYGQSSLVELEFLLLLRLLLLG